MEFLVAFFNKYFCYKPAGKNIAVIMFSGAVFCILFYLVAPVPVLFAGVSMCFFLGVAELLPTEDEKTAGIIRASAFFIGFVQVVMFLYGFTDFVGPETPWNQPEPILSVFI